MSVLSRDALAPIELVVAEAPAFPDDSGVSPVLFEYKLSGIKRGSWLNFLGVELTTVPEPAEQPVDAMEELFGGVPETDDVLPISDIVKTFVVRGGDKQLNNLATEMVDGVRMVTLSGESAAMQKLELADISVAESCVILSSAVEESLAGHLPDPVGAEDVQAMQYAVTLLLGTLTVPTELAAETRRGLATAVSFGTYISRIKQFGFGAIRRYVGIDQALRWAMQVDENVGQLQQAIQHEYRDILAN